MSKAKKGTADASAGGGDGRFFTTTKKGETHELRQELASQNREKKTDALKKVIANMTVGKDVSMLFTDVVNCIQTGNIELKKLVYLYLINYAKSQPDLALLAVNTFVKDANDPNPLMRALAVRTMGCIRVERITEYLCEPLARCLRDEDPYVRKTAAVCVAKLYDISAELVEDRGFMDGLRDLISDSNPTVVANAVAALSEIAETSGKDMMLMTTSILQKLLAALNECTEWGQVFILDSLARYAPADGREAEGIIERVTPRLQHANSAVVMSAVKVILAYMGLISNQDSLRALSRKLAPPLVTLLNSEPEVQYVALRNINLIVQKRPKILEHEIKVFFCKYNDPIYVKLEKLEIMIRLVSERNIDQVLLEFKEYAQEVDVDFVRRSVRAIGRCAIKLERAAQRCINVLLELIQTKVNYVVQEAVIVTKDIFRRYPQKYESIIGTLCENLDTLDEPEAKASMIWIIGEYAEQIDNADELLDTFLDSFEEETSQVQLQLLTATVKLFLKQPADTQDMVQKVLNMATEDSDNPDLRDRGYVYWRLLSTNPEAAKAVVLADKPTIADDTFTLEPTLLDELIMQLSTLASIYHKPPEAFVMRVAGPAGGDKQADDDDDYDDDYDADADDGEGGEGGGPGLTGDSGGASAPTPTPAPAGGVDLLDMMSAPAAPAPAPAAPAGGALDLFGGGPAAPAGGAPAVVKVVVCPASAQSGGVQIAGAIARDVAGPGAGLTLEVDVSNMGQQPVSALAMQFNKSTFGLAPSQPQLAWASPIMPGASAPYALPLTLNPALVDAASAPNLGVQIAVKNMTTAGVFYFAMQLPLQSLFGADGQMERQHFLETWKAIDDSLEANSTVSELPTANIEAITQKLAVHHVFYLSRNAKPGAEGQEVVYYSCKTLNGLEFMLELTFKHGVNAVKVCVKTKSQPYAELAKSAIESLIKS